MDFINFYAVLPHTIYTKLESEAKRKKIDKNEIIIQALLCFFLTDNKSFARKKSARFDNFYN